MRLIRMYTTSRCPFCLMAKRLLQNKGVSFEEISVEGDMPARERMCSEAGGCWTVPQIFIGERHVGGYDDIAELDRQGQLDPLLEEPPGKD